MLSSTAWVSIRCIIINRRFFAWIYISCCTGDAVSGDTLWTTPVKPPATANRWILPTPRTTSECPECTRVTSPSSRRRADVRAHPTTTTRQPASPSPVAVVPVRRPRATTTNTSTSGMRQRWRQGRRGRDSCTAGRRRRQAAAATQRRRRLAAVVQGANAVVLGAAGDFRVAAAVVMAAQKLIFVALGVIAVILGGTWYTRGTTAVVQGATNAAVCPRRPARCLDKRLTLSTPRRHATATRNLHQRRRDTGPTRRSPSAASATSRAGLLLGPRGRGRERRVSGRDGAMTSRDESAPTAVTSRRRRRRMGRLVVRERHQHVWTILWPYREDRLQISRLSNTGAPKARSTPPACSPGVWLWTQPKENCAMRYAALRGEWKYSLELAVTRHTARRRAEIVPASVDECLSQS